MCLSGFLKPLPAVAAAAATLAQGGGLDGRAAGVTRSDAEGFSPEAAPADLTEAEPISPDTVRRFPHLAPYIGHILIGTTSLQAVLGGVPTTTPHEAWQAAALGFFSLQQGYWRRQEALTSVDLQNTAPSIGPQLYPVAVDIGRDPDGGVAYVSFIYSAAAAPAIKQLVTWRLDGSLGRLAVYFDQFVAASSPSSTLKTPPLAPYWRLRLHGDGVDLLAPPLGRGGTRGSSYLLRYRGTNVISILGYRPFTLKDNVLSPASFADKGDQAPPVEGLEFLLTPAATATLMARAETLRDCLYGVERPRADLRDEAKIEWTQSCDTVLTLANLRLHLNVSDSAPASPEPVFIFNAAGRLVQYVTAVSSIGLSVALPAGSYQLADTAAGRVTLGVPNLTLSAGESKDITLPARRVGSLRVKTGSPEPGAVLLGLEPLLDRYRDVNVFGESSPDLSRLSPHVWLVAKDNFETKLLSGSYLLSLARGRSGVYCRQRVVVMAGQGSMVDCGQMGIKPPLALGREIAFADLALPTPGAETAGPLLASPGSVTLWNDTLKEALGEALGLDVQPALPVTVDHEDGGRLAEHLLPVLTISSGNTDVTLRYWPATRSLSERWLQALRTGPADPIGRFTRFAQDEGVDGWTELGCPGPTTSVAEYRQLVLRLAPTAVRLFGCGAITQQDPWIDLWAELATQRPLPLLLTAASTLEAPESGAFLPRIAFEATRDVLAHKGGAWSILSRRAFSLSSGATAFMRPLGTTGTGGRRATHGAASDLHLAITVLPPARAREIIIYTEKGRLKRAFLPLDFGPKGLVTVPAVNLGKAKWLRVEVRGLSGHLLGGPRGDGMDNGDGRTDSLLAATNFASIGDLVLAAKPEESR